MGGKVHSVRAAWSREAMPKRRSEIGFWDGGIVLGSGEHLDRRDRKAVGIRIAAFLKAADGAKDVSCLGRAIADFKLLSLS